MNTRTYKSIFLSVLIAVLIVVVVVATATNRKQALKTQHQVKQQEEHVKDVLPPVTSSIKGVDVVNAFVDEKGDARITVFNNTKKGIRGIAVTAGPLTFSDDNGSIETGLPDLIAAHSSYTMSEPASNLLLNVPLHVSAVFYNDKSEDGEVDARKAVNDVREKEKQRKLHESKDKKG